MPDYRSRKKTKMKRTTNKVAASAAMLLTCALFVMTASAARADDYCITNGAQEAHGCGYPTMEACRADSAGIGGMCVRSLSAKSPGDAQAYQPKQSKSRLRSNSTPKEPAAN
jgi:hypothetical protein